MRIKQIELEWFRGAAHPISLPLAQKSVVVYGPNGSGKSSFVDAVEYAIQDGKIMHLANEYSGKHQVKGIRNTHAPKTQNTRFAITFADDTALDVKISPDGRSRCSGENSALMASWDYQRCVLRQHDVVDFILSRKGEKYATLLPLLGLGEMEIVADNLRQLGTAIQQEAQVERKRGQLQNIAAQRRDSFGDAGDAAISDRIEALHEKYLPDVPLPEKAATRCTGLKMALAEKRESATADQRRHFILRAIADTELSTSIEEVRKASTKLAESAEAFIDEKLEVLRFTEKYAQQLVEEGDVPCPACGRPIAVADLREHVERESTRLDAINELFNNKKSATGRLIDDLKAIGSNLTHEDLTTWVQSIQDGELAKSLEQFQTDDPEGLRHARGEADLKRVEETALPLVKAARHAATHAPTEATELSDDARTVDAAQKIVDGEALKTELSRAEDLVAFTSTLETAVREEIRSRAQQVIGEISGYIQAMWSTLHPNKPIKDVCLKFPEDADKAIEVALKFYGVAQDSPLLTLSEGYRNALGLCIFFAMAKKDTAEDRPLFLDDVVISLDREHRGMVVELLETQFADRQVVIFTHDRDWYAELKQQLDPAKWQNKRLFPHEHPETGIRWSDTAGSFDDARALLQCRPEAAGNDARRILDVKLPSIAEKLRLKFPYLSGEKNDRRMAHDFLQRLVADRQTCLQRKVDGKYKPYEEALKAWDKARKLIASWANRATHSYDVERPEAAKLIDACEEAWNFFQCPSCKKQLRNADVAGTKSTQCDCGQIRWRYGKG